MESQMVRPHGHTYEQDPYKAHQDPHLAMEGEDEHHREKKSVLKKVKAKAKKIKDTITKHGHGQDHDHQGVDHIPDDHDLDEEDDDDESIEDPEVHGAPMYESTKVTMGTTPANTPVPSFTDHGVSDKMHKETSHEYDPSQTFLPGKESTTKVNLNTPKGLERDPHAPNKAELGRDSASNYQTKVNDPTGKGGKEIGTTQMLHSFDKMNLGDSNLASSTGSHDQFSPEEVPGDRDHAAVKPTSYTDKVTAATSAIAGKAASAKDTIVSKLGYGENTKPDSSSTGSYTDKVSSVTSAIAGKAASAKDAVVSKLGYGAGTENPSPATVTGEGKQDKGVSVKEYFVEKLRPGDDDRALSEAISDALHRREPTVEGDSGSGKGVPLGKVTQSEAVTRHLGEDRGSEKEALKGGSENNSYVDKVKGTVGSWLGLGNTEPDRSKVSSQENVHGKAGE